MANMLLLLVAVTMATMATMASLSQGAQSPTPGALSCNGEGFGIGGYCSCNSGYGYPLGNAFACNSETVPACVSTIPSALNTTNSPAFLPVGSGTSFANDVVTLGIDAPLTSGRENFTVSWYGYQSAACNFPGPNWVQSVSQTGSCADVFTATLSWPFLRANCGFGTPIATNINGVPFLEYSNAVSVRYDEYLPAAFGVVASRTVQNSLSLSVDFQTEITVTSTQLTVNGTSLSQLQFAVQLIAQSYNTTTGLATLVYQTIVDWPYLLATPILPSLPSNIASDTIADTTDYAVTCIPGVDGATNNPVCVQTWTVTLTPAAQACDITGLYHLDFDAGCQASLHSACPVAGSAAWVNVTSGVQSSDFCPSLTLQALLVASLTAYTDNTYTTPQTATYTNGAVAYFQADVSSPQATILNSVIIDVSVNNGNGPASLCTASVDGSGNPECAPTAFGSNNSISGSGLAFQPSNGGITDFHFLVSVVGVGVPYGPGTSTGAIFSLAAGSQGTFTVSATIVVQYVGNQRRIVKFKEVVERRQSGQTRQMDATASISIASVDNSGNGGNGGGSGSGNPSSSTKSSSSSSSVNVAAVGGIVGALVGVAAVGVAVARKKKEQKQNKMIFTEMDAKVAPTTMTSV